MPHLDKKAVACGGGSKFTPENQTQPAANAGTQRNEKQYTIHDIARVGNEAHL